MQIAIVSDSHGSLDRLSQVLESLHNTGIKHLIHAGDGINYGIEDIFAKYPEIKIYYSLGNCDVNQELANEINQLPNCEVKEVISTKINGVKIAASHVEGIAQAALKNEDIKIFCHGHTHRAKVEERNEKLILNPGALMEDGKYFVLNTETFDVEQRSFQEKIRAHF